MMFKKLKKKYQKQLNQFHDFYFGVEPEERKNKDMSKKEEFRKWIREGLEQGFVQQMDEQMRKQYGIEEECTPEHWEDAKKYFKE